MDPAPPTRSTIHPSISSIEFVEKYDPSSSVDFLRRANKRGIIDLGSASSTTDPNQHDKALSSSKKRKQQPDKLSTPGGKRTLTVDLHVIQLSRRAKPLEERWDQGQFRWVHKGQYVGGLQHGQLCVHKEFKTGSVYEDSFYSKDILAVKKATSINREFNIYSKNIMGRKQIYIIQPRVWQKSIPDSTGRHKKFLTEPMLEGRFLKFNSNSGYTDGAELMQALSHFSYHHTNRKHLQCDLQGGHYEDCCYILTDPIIMSSDNSKEYGAGDLGSEGIDNFFAQHKCNKFCCPFWDKPIKPQVSNRIPRMAKSSLSLTLGTRQSEAQRLHNLKLANQTWVKSEVV